MQLPKKTLCSSILGSFIEFYDFTLFGYFSVAISSTFFPAHDPYISLLYTYTIFAVAFFFRPLGAILFGTMGDLYGRKVALSFSILLMGISTLAIAICPSYTTLGGYSSIIILISRILQGVSAGGEYSGSIILTVESSVERSRGLTGSLVITGCMLGALMGSYANYFFSDTSDSWRFAFLIGSTISVLVLYIRSYIEESPEYIPQQVSNKISHLFQGIKENYLGFLLSVLISGYSGILFYVMSMCLPTYLIKHGYMLQSNARLSVTFSTLIMLTFIPVFGFLSDKIGRPKLVRISSVLIFLSFYPFMKLIAWGDNTILIMAIFTFSLMLASYMGAMNTFILELFPPQYRYYTVATSFSIGISLFGGTSPLVWTYLENNMSVESVLLIYLAMMFVFCLLIGLLIPSATRPNKEMGGVVVDRHEKTSTVFVAEVVKKSA